MKPENWDTMSESHKTRIAEDLLRNVRGRFLIGQALYRAAEAMANDPLPEISNIEDMEVLSRAFPVMNIDAQPMSAFSERAREKYRDESHR